MDEIFWEMDFEILNQNHSIANYDGNDAEYLINFALNDNEDDDKVTHLIMRNNEIIGYFTLFVDFNGLSPEIYNQVKIERGELPDRDMMPVVKVVKLSLIQKYNKNMIRDFVKLNIVENVNQIYCNYFDGVCIEMIE